LDVASIKSLPNSAIEFTEKNPEKTNIMRGNRGGRKRLFHDLFIFKAFLSVLA